MFDYYDLISKFIKDNFEPTYPDLANVKFTTEEFLQFLFLSFPNDCISDYELNEILLSLDFERFTYTVDRITIEKGKDEFEEDKITTTHQLVNGWCMFSNRINSKEKG